MQSPLGEIPEGWKVDVLKDLVLKVGSGATPTGGAAAYTWTRSGFALVRSQNVFDRYFSEEGLAFINDEQAGRLTGVHLQENDLLLNITGDGVTFGRSCMVPKEVLPACVNQHVSIIRVDRGKLDPGYLLSYLTLPQTKAYIESFNAGGSRRALTKANIEKFVVPYPELDEQRSIASILGALDDKIELNRRMNGTLEAMAQALFKEWFVDGAKEEWEEKPFADTVNVFAGGTPKTKVPEYWDGDIPWFAIADASPSDVYVTDTERKVSQAGIDNSSAQVVKAGTTILTARGTVGQTVLTGVPMAMNQSCFGLWGIHDRHGYFTYFQTKHVAELFQQYSHGSVFNTINRSTFETLRVVMPDAKTIHAFEDLVHPMMQRILNNIHESRTLAALRDTLLPKLMRGEVRVKDVRSVVDQSH